MTYRLYLRHTRHRTLRFLATFDASDLLDAVGRAACYRKRATADWRLYLRPQRPAKA